jgi:malate synthase
MTLGSARAHDKWDATQPRGARVDGIASAALETINSVGPVSKADFVGCVDRCVRLLIAEPFPDKTNIRSAHTQLRSWLYGNAQSLEDGTPIDFALFDAAILSIEERLPQTGAHAQARLLHASRLLAETVYAKT